MWSLELTSAWMRLDVACRSHARAESEPLITTALAMLPRKRPAVACTGCVAEARSYNVHITRSLDGMSSLEPFPAFATDIFPKLQVDISERVNLLRFANLAATFSIRSAGVLAVCISSRPRRPCLFCFGPAYNGHIGRALRCRLPRRSFIASSVYHHLASSPLFVPPLIVLLAI
jgi:hypothetical protein